jgi:hypothetical protein
VTTIGEAAFYECKGLPAIELPNSVTTIGRAAFTYCYALTSVTLGNSVTTIGEFAFFLSAITSITIPESATEFHRFAFGSCDKLTEVINLSPVPQDIEIDPNAAPDADPNLYVFGNIDTKNITLKVPTGSINAYRTAPIWKDFRNYVGF